MPVDRPRGAGVEVEQPQLVRLGLPTLVLDRRIVRLGEVEAERLVVEHVADRISRSRR